MTLLREQGRPPFDAGDTALLAGLSAPLGDAVREHAQGASRPPPGSTGAARA